MLDSILATVFFPLYLVSQAAVFALSLIIEPPLMLVDLLIVQPIRRRWFK